MASKPFPMPQTLQSAGIEQHLKREAECDASRRGENLGGPNGIFGPAEIDRNWEHDYLIRSEYNRQEGEVQGKSTYTQGTVFAIGGRTRRIGPPEEAEGDQSI